VSSYAKPLIALSTLVLLVQAASPAQAGERTLLATVGPGFEIFVKDSAGQRVSHVEPGSYRIEVRDASDVHNFHLFGPNRATRPHRAGRPVPDPRPGSLACRQLPPTRPTHRPQDRRAVQGHEHVDSTPDDGGDLSLLLRRAPSVVARLVPRRRLTCSPVRPPGPVHELECHLCQSWLIRPVRLATLGRSKGQTPTRARERRTTATRFADFEFGRERAS
jgi:hypothetical protein